MDLPRVCKILSFFCQKELKPQHSLRSKKSVCKWKRNNDVTFIAIIIDIDDMEICIWIYFWAICSQYDI